jgi:hypothetical protein
MNKKEILDENQDKITKFNTKKYDIKEDYSKKINVFLPVRDRDNTRIRRCIQSIKNNNQGLVDKIILVDIGSTKPIKAIKGTIMERVECSTWNKAFGLNKAILKYPNEFIMTVDIDMLLSDLHFVEIKESLNPMNFICDTNVRRMKTNFYKKDYNEMLLDSKPWRNRDTNQFFNSANGGIQIYSYGFFTKINGIQEGLGLYHGSVDNIMYYRARMNGLKIVDLGTPLIHMEHKKQKEENYSESERQLALGYRQFKANYLNHVVKARLNKNPEKIAGEFPDMSLFYEYKQSILKQQELVQKAIDEGKDSVVIGYQTFKLEKAKPRVLLVVINNYGSVPDYFMYDIINLLNYTKARGYDVDLQKVDACDIASLRNIAIKTSLGMNHDKKEYDYVMQLDDDHKYPSEFLVRFIELCEQNNWPIITGLTPGKKYPFKNTQYYKLTDDITAEDNSVVCKKPKNEIIDIEASGPVGMLIKTSIFKNLPFPWYHTEYFKKKIIVKEKVNIDGELKEIDKEVEMDAFMGSDLVFCKLLKEYNIPIKLDLSVNFPHEKKFFLSRGEVIIK